MEHEQNKPVSDASDEMTNYGITCVPVDNFHYREFHYTNLRDAIAQAKRDGIRGTHS